MEKVGVVLSKAFDMREVFMYYDSDKQGMINYKTFAADLFSNKKTKKTENSSNVDPKKLVTLEDKYAMF